MAIKRYLNVDETKDGSQYIAGVPLDDLSDEQYDALPEWQQHQVDHSGLYRKTQPAASTDKKPSTDKNKEG